MVRRKQDMRKAHVSSPMESEGAEWPAMGEFAPARRQDGDLDEGAGLDEWPADSLQWHSAAQTQTQEFAEAGGESSFLGFGPLHTVGAQETSQASGEKGKRVGDLAFGFASPTRADSPKADPTLLDGPLDSELTDLDDADDELTEPDGRALDDVYLLQEGPMAVDPLDPTKDAWKFPGPEDELETTGSHRWDDLRESITALTAELDSSLDDPVRMYLREIGRVPLLSAEQEVSLAKRMERGKAERDKPRNQQSLRVLYDAEEAQRQLTEANLRLVVSVAKKYIGRA